MGLYSGTEKGTKSVTKRNNKYHEVFSLCISASFFVYDSLVKLRAWINKGCE